MMWWVSLCVCGALSWYGGLVAGGEQFPGWSGRDGLKAFVSSGLALRPRQLARAAEAKRSIKIIDSYWGQANDFRRAIATALAASADCKVSILVARREGHFASIRGALDVDAQLPANLVAIDELKRTAADEVPGADTRISVHCFDVIVPGPMMIIDDVEVFAGTFLQNPGGSPDAPALWLKRGWLRTSPAVNVYVSTFEAIWAKSTPCA